MGLFTSHEFNNLEDLFQQQLGDLYDTEQRLIKALPKMADAAHSSSLKSAFTEHLEQTKNQAHRLENIFRQLGMEPKRETCEAMKGLVSEGEEMIGAKGDSDVKDAALIAAAQRVEHYEMAGYGTARTFAERLGHHQAAQLLQETLDEEKETDSRLTRIAMESVNIKAQHT